MKCTLRGCAEIVNANRGIKYQYISLDDDMPPKKYEEMEDYLTDRLEIAHDLITRLRQLLTMEKTGAVMDHSLNRTRFFKMDDDYGNHLFIIILCE